MLHLKHLEDITEADLQALTSIPVREGQLIDYKRDINLTIPKAKTELVRDVSSFANASGGDIVIGMTEDDGVPKELIGIKTTDFEALEQQILQVCRAQL